MKHSKLKLRRWIIAASGMFCAVFLFFMLRNKSDGGSVPAVLPQAMPESLIQAAAANDYAAVGYLLGQGADVNQSAPNGETALMIAAEKGYTPLVAILLQAGADPGSADKLGRHALAAAAGKGHLEVIRTLLRYRADINAGADRNQTALLTACRAGENGAVELLLQHKPLLFPGVTAGCGPLSGALQNRHVQTAIILLEYGANAYERDVNGNTMLHLAVQCGSVELCEILLEKYNIDPVTPNNNGESAADWARKSGNKSLIKLLER